MTTERINPFNPNLSYNDRILMMATDHIYEQIYTTIYQEVKAPRVVLDFGCGFARPYLNKNDHRNTKVYGYDSDRNVINYLKRSVDYGNLFGDVEFTNELPNDDVNVIIMSQVIEHIKEPDKLILSLMAKYNPQLMFIVTPNRDARLFKGQKPWNKHHVTEYNKAQLHALLDKYATVTIDEFSIFDGTSRPETCRYNRNRVFAYPVTWPGCPEWIRQAGLSIMSFLSLPDTCNYIPNVKVTLTTPDDKGEMLYAVCKAKGPN